MIDPLERRPLHTTTVRVDDHLWGRIILVSHLLDIPKAEVFRSGARELITRIELSQQELAAMAGIPESRRAVGHWRGRA